MWWDRRLLIVLLLLNWTGFLCGKEYKEFEEIDHPENWVGKSLKCKTTSEQCRFPPEGRGTAYGCVTDRERLCENKGGGGEAGTCDGLVFDEKHYCEIVIDDISEPPWAECSQESGSTCFKDGSDPLEPEQFTGRDDPAASFCNSVPTKCIFPFKHMQKGTWKTYHQCTTDLIDDSDAEVDNEYSDPKLQESFAWCATSVSTDSKMEIGKGGKWGICGTCEVEFDETPETIYTVANFLPDTEDGIKGTIEFKEQKGGILHITGKISGLPQGSHGFHVHEKAAPPNDCSAAGGHFNPHAAKHGSLNSKVRHAGDLGNIKTNANGETTIDIKIMPGTPSSVTTLFGENKITGRSLVIHQLKDDLGLNGTLESESTGSAGSRLACAIIEEKVDEAAALEWYIYLLIALFIVLLIIIAVLTYIYCKRKDMYPVKKKEKEMEAKNGVKTSNGPLYDELSIPFIDASPTNTPKIGRSVERLSFFNRTPSIGRSRGSLSNEEATA